MPVLDRNGAQALKSDWAQADDPRSVRLIRADWSPISRFYFQMPDAATSDPMCQHYVGSAPHPSHTLR
eukprot:gene5816-15859_t